MYRKLQNIRKVLLIAFSAAIIAVVTYYFFPVRKLPKGSKVDKILVEKSIRKMHVYSKGKKLKTYSISLGFRPHGKKRFEKDGKTPEGKYYIVSKNSQSIAHKSFGISYPNAVDKKYAAKRGCDYICESVAIKLLLHFQTQIQAFYGMGECPDGDIINATFGNRTKG